MCFGLLCVYRVPYSCTALGTHTTAWNMEDVLQYSKKHHEGVWGNKVIAPLILKFGIRHKWVLDVTDIILLVALCPLVLTQPLTEMSTRNISWGVKVAGAQGWQPYHLHVPIVLKSGSLNLLESSGLVQACNGIAFPLSIEQNVVWTSELV
jgi:hypothetical protein